MKTSYFYYNEIINNPNAVSIAAKAPDWYKGKQYKKLAPKYNWWKQWKDQHLSNEWYTKKYYETVLNKLNPKEVYKELGENAILLCYERPGTFCHRRLVAEWLENNLGIVVQEL